MFPELSNPKAVKDYIEKKDLSELIVGESKLTDYSYEYFITYTPDANGQTKASKDRHTAQDAAVYFGMPMRMNLSVTVSF